MKRILLVLVLLGVLPSGAADPVRQAAAEQRPGYGIVESMTPLQRAPEASASAGASGRGRRDATTWLVRVRMEDGTIQVREMKKRSVGVGSRVLLTNAGDILPD